MLRLFQPGPGGEATLHQLGLAIVVLLRIEDRIARRLDVGTGAAQVRLQRRDVDLGVGDPGIGLVDRDPVRIGIDPEQDVAGPDLLVLADVDRDDAPGDVG